MPIRPNAGVRALTGTSTRFHVGFLVCPEGRAAASCVYGDKLFGRPKPC